MQQIRDLLKVNQNYFKSSGSPVSAQSSYIKVSSTHPDSIHQAHLFVKDDAGRETDAKSGSKLSTPLINSSK